MGPWKKKAAAVGAVLAVAFGTMAAVHRGGGNDKVRYEFGHVTRGDVTSYVEATGQVQPWKTVDVKSDVAGKIMKMFVDLGDHVKAGQLIALIDPTDTQAALTQAQAQVSSDAAKQVQAQITVGQQRAQLQSQVASAEHAVQAAKVKEAEALVNAKAQPGLTSAGVTQANAQLLAAQEAVTEAQQSRQQLQEQLATLQSVTIPLNTQTVTTTAQQAQASYQTSLADYQRQRQLLGAGYVAQSVVDTAYAKMSSDRAAVQQAQQRQKTLDQENALQVKQLQAQIGVAQHKIAEAQAQVKQAKSAVSVAQQNRYVNSDKQQEYQAAVAARKQAEADLATARANLQLIPVRQQDVLAARDLLMKDQASLKQAQINMGYTRVVAPRDGVIITKNVEEGTVVPSSKSSVGSTSALVQVGDTSKLWVICNVDETDIAQVHVGQVTQVKFDAFPDTPVPGKVVRIDPQTTVVQGVTMIPVTVQLDQPDDRFEPGMNATCDFIAAQAKNVLTVPNEAIHGAGRHPSVNELVNGKVVQVPITTGVAGQDTTEITSGLNEGDAVITRIMRPQQKGNQQTNNPFGSPIGGGRGGRGGMGGGRGR